MVTFEEERALKPLKAPNSNDAPVSDVEHALIESLVFLEPLKLPKQSASSDYGDEKLGLLFLDVESDEADNCHSSDTFN